MRPQVEEELDRLVTEGILEPAKHSEWAKWATPVVAALKSDKKTVRLCGDFRKTVNPVARLDRYPVPKVEDLFATLKQGPLFTKLDLRNAYQQATLRRCLKEVCCDQHYYNYGYFAISGSLLESHLLLRFFRDKWSICSRVFLEWWSILMIF